MSNSLQDEIRDDKMKHCKIHDLHYAVDGTCFWCLVAEYKAKQAENAKSE